MRDAHADGGVHLRPGLLESDRWLEPGNRAHPVEIAGLVVRCEPQRHPDLPGTAVEGAAFREDSDDGVGLPVGAESRGPTQRRIASKLAFPKRETEDGDMIVPDLVLPGDEWVRPWPAAIPKTSK